MIKIAKLTKKGFSRHQFLLRSFNYVPPKTHSKVIDPYEFLGVDRNEEFVKIKKKYYQLVKEFHPDKNEGKDVETIFKTIQESFDRIKEDRGMKVRMSLRNENDEDIDDFESQRPDAHLYDEDFDDFQQQYREFDFNEYAYREENSEFFEQSRSFREIHSATSAKFEVREGRLKNTFKRFGISRERLKWVSDSSTWTPSILAGATIIVAGVIAYSVSLSTRKREQDKGKLLAEVTAKRDTKEKSLTQMETGSRKFIEGTSTYQEMKKKKESLGIGEDTDPEVIRTKLLLMDVGEYDPDAEDENDAIL